MNSSARSGREDKDFCKDVSSQFSSKFFNSSSFFLSYITISFGRIIALYFTVILTSTKVTMPRFEIDVDPCDHITADAIGNPGQRVFYIQAYQDQRTVTVIIEKTQLHSLAIGVEQFLAQIYEQNPTIPEASGDYVEDMMRINPPVDPLFRVGEIGLGYDKERDLVVLFVKELLTEE